MPSTKEAGGTPVYQPTPTQAENDLAAMGQNVVEKEADGSVPAAPGPQQAAPPPSPPPAEPQRAPSKPAAAPAAKPPEKKEPAKE